MPFGNRKKLRALFSSVLSHFKKDRPTGNLNLNNLSIFPNLKLRISLGKFLLISLKLIFTPILWAWIITVEDPCIASAIFLYSQDVSVKDEWSQI